MDSDDGSGVVIATVHGAKGLEFDTVFVVGCEEKIFPISRDDNDDLEEERRLMYVAITRARKDLFLTSAQSRFMYGSRDRQMASRFIKEMGLATFDSQPSYSRNEYSTGYSSYGNGYNRDVGYSGREYTSKYSSDNYSSANSYSSNASYSTYSDYAKSTTSFAGQSSNGLSNLQNLMNNKLQSQKKSFSDYKVGVQVLHTKFGVGTIVKTDDAGGNNYVSVDFGKLGVKTLSLNFAPLQILKK